MASVRKLFPDSYINKKFGKLYVTGPEVRKPKNDKGYLERYVYCDCDCGNKQVLIPLTKIMRGEAKSCGCGLEEAKRKFSEGRHNNTLKTIPPTVHGDSVHSSEYYNLHHIWIGMRRRCNNPNDKSYPDYGGAGIKVCPEWDADYRVFKDWALQNGYITGLSIDRLDNSKGYSPDNCRWASDYMQANNKGNNVFITSREGESHTASEWCEFYGVRKSRLKDITDWGLTPEQALEQLSKESNNISKPFIIVNQLQYEKGSKELEERGKKNE